MKRIFLLAILCLGLASCGAKEEKKEEKPQSDTQKEVVEVLYFHGKQRCPTCIAIEERTKEVVEGEFAANLKDGSLVFKSIDIEENEALADKYEIS